MVLLQTNNTMAATSKYKDKDSGVLFSFNGIWVSWLHTVVAYGTCCVTKAPTFPSSTSPRTMDLFAIYTLMCCAVCG